MSKRGNIDHFYFPVLPTLPAFTDLFPIYRIVLRGISQTRAEDEKMADIYK